MTYVCSSFLPQFNGFAWVKHVSPFAWYLDGQPLRNGLNWVYCGLLVGVGALFAAAGVWRFRRRDLT